MCQAALGKKDPPGQYPTGSNIQAFFRPFFMSCHFGGFFCVACYRAKSGKF
jgi:hypothetical protein